MKVKCEDCIYYDKVSGLCGFCMKKILKEVEKNYDRQNKDKGAE